jgi:phosphate transport system permease protein
MTLLAPPSPQGSTQLPDDVPIKLQSAPTRADRVFNSILAGSSGTVLLILIIMVIFLCYYGFPAFQKAGFGLFTDPTWSPDTGHFGMMSLLVGSIAIALIGVAIATPISICTSLMINEYAPRRFKPVLTAVIDMLATVPSIVYGFWGLLVISNVQAAPARWLAQHVGYFPLLRTAVPDRFVKSIFACGLICAVTIIPIITSITREVMAQAPRDVCEAALGLGGTRWAMVTEVILPFSRNGILGAVLLGIGRGLGETMIVVLVLSPGNTLTPDLLGPSGLGSIARQITDDFVNSPTIAQDGLILIGFVLFVTTLAINIAARSVVERPNRNAQ